MRQTSVAVYNEIKENGLLNRVNTLIYECIFKHGPLSIKETCRLLPNIPETTISPRFADLERRKAITSIGTRPCKITGNTVHSWDVTNKLPVAPEKKKKVKCYFCDGSGFTEVEDDKN